MKLIYLLQRYSWFLEHCGEWHALDNAASIELSTSVFPLVCKDEYEMPQLPAIRGSATVVLENTDTAVHVCITDTDKSIIHEENIDLNINHLSILEWGENPYDDQWVDSSVTLNVEYANSVQLKLYLPQSEYSQGKKILIRDEPGNQCSEFYIERGIENDITIFSAEQPQDHRFLITCEPEKNVNSSDARSLGYVLLDTIVTV